MNKKNISRFLAGCIKVLLGALVINSLLIVSRDVFKLPQVADFLRADVLFSLTISPAPSASQSDPDPAPTPARAGSRHSSAPADPAYAGTQTEAAAPASDAAPEEPAETPEPAQEEAPSAEPAETPPGSSEESPSTFNEPASAKPVAPQETAPTGKAPRPSAPETPPATAPAEAPAETPVGTGTPATEAPEPVPAAEAPAEPGGETLQVKESPQKSAATASELIDVNLQEVSAEPMDFLFVIQAVLTGALLAASTAFYFLV